MELTITAKHKILHTIDTHCGSSEILKGIEVGFTIGNLKGIITFPNTDFNTTEDILKYGIESELKSIALILATASHQRHE